MRSLCYHKPAAGKRVHPKSSGIAYQGSIMSVKKQLKIPKSTKTFISKKDGNKSDFAKLFSDRKLKQGLGTDNYIKAASLLATGFSQKKYYGKNKRKKVRQAKLLLQDFYDLSTQHGKTKIFRPSEKNRKLFAKELGISKKFKVYAMPVFSDNDVYKVIKNKKRKKLKLSGEFIDTELFEFEDMKKAAKNPRKETNILLKEIKKKFGSQPRDMKIKCGEYLSHFSTDVEDDISDQNEIIDDTVSLWFNKYKHHEQGRGGAAKDWLRGIQVTTFKKQESYKIATERRGGKYLAKKKPKKTKSKRDRIKGR